MKINEMTQEEIISNLENEEIINQIYDLIKKFCWKNNCYDEDLVQELILLVIKGISTFDYSKSKFTTWLYKICINKLYADYRSKNSLKRKGEVISLNTIIKDEGGRSIELWELIPEYKESEEEIFKKYTVQIIYSNLSSLSKSYFDGKNQNELAKEYNLSQAQISRMIAKEIKEIKKKLEVNL